MHGSDSEEMDPSDKVTSPLLAKSPLLPMKVQKAPYKLNRQTRVSHYLSLEMSPKSSSSKLSKKVMPLNGDGKCK